MKPDWKDLPEWVNYVAHDRDGIHIGYENQPTLCKNFWLSNGGRETKLTNEYWEQSLQQRPQGE